VASATAAIPTATARPPTPPAPATIVFIENDYPHALAEARARHVPLFIDAWATWCHTCLSMRSYVFPDPALRGFADRFVWLSIDTERDENAAIVARLVPHVLPTLYVLEPATERPVLAWPGSLTATELVSLLDDAELAARHGDAGGDAAAALLRGHQARAAGNLQDAITAYRAALAAAPADWPRRPQAVDALVASLADDKQHAVCVTTAAEEAARLPPGTPVADVLRSAFGCIEKLPRSAPERTHLAALVKLGEQVATDLTQPILADDRSDLFDYVVQALKDQSKHADDVKRVATAWASFLEDQAAKAPSPPARQVFDAHRMLAYLALNQPERAVPMFEQSERDFPDDYNPPSRLAKVFLVMKRYADAEAAVSRSLSRAYGARKLTLWSLQDEIFEAQDKRADAKRALEAALAFAKTIPLTGSYPRLRDSLEKRLAKLR
jgi:tetratricopeptide (TPR) repeat protein